jgi:hypothetical protein
MSAGATLLALNVADPAYAHGSVAVAIHSDGRGAVWVVATWEDGHPIAQRVAAALLAFSQDRQQVGPTPLRQGFDAPGTLRFNGTLTPGVWTVTIDVADPGLQHCTAIVPVAPATATPRPTKHGFCGAPPAPPAAALVDTSGGVGWWLLGGPVAVALLGGAALIYVRGGRSRRRMRGPARSLRRPAARPRSPRGRPSGRSAVRARRR